MPSLARKSGPRNCRRSPRERPSVGGGRGGYTEGPRGGSGRNVLKKYLTPFDPEVQTWATEARLLRWLTLLWLGIGLVVLVLASYPAAELATGDGWYFCKRQLVWAAIGLFGFNILVRVPLRNLHRFAPLGLLLLLGAIWATQLAGTEVNGSDRWFKLGKFLFQPSEVIKPFLVLQGAYIFGSWERLSKFARRAWLGIFALVLAGILIQPNLSNTALCGMVLWIIAFAAGLPLVVLGGVAFGGLAVAGTSLALVPYQMARVTSFMNPFEQAQGQGYQLVQSLYAIGSGGLWGQGFGFSQQKLLYLPFQDTDFIFAVFAEEFGFVGCIFLLILILTFGTLAARVALKARTPVQKLVAVGAMAFIVGQSLINIGVAAGALPTTGLTLPFFSYGGNSLLASFALAALLVRVARESNEAIVVPLPLTAQERRRRFREGKRLRREY